MDNRNNQLAPRQQDLELFPVKEVEVDGVQMGVMNDGTPFLTGRSLAVMCGVHHSVIQDLSTGWSSERLKPRGKKIDAIIREQGFEASNLYIPSTTSRRDHYHYPDYVCMAVLEYYAFDASQANNDVALRNYRLMARRTLRDFIYKSVGIDPSNPISGAWKCFQERITLNDTVPAGYYSVFREMVDITVPLINAGFELGPKTVPDISVGVRWANHWKRNNFDERYGSVVKHPHVYPDWFPQSKVGPVPATLYPEESLGEFRRWLREDYVPKGFREYLSDKVQQKVIENKKALEVLENLRRPELPKK